MELHNLLCPHLLSEELLRGILKERCIEIPEGIKNITKDDLVEIYNRIVLPISQRKYNEKRPLGQRMNHIRISRKVTISSDEDIKKYSEIQKSGSNDCKKNNRDSKNENNKFNNTNVNSNGFQQFHRNNFSGQRNSSFGGNFDQKRKNQAQLHTDPSKRQKITWP